MIAGELNTEKYKKGLDDIFKYVKDMDDKEASKILKPLELILEAYNESIDILIFNIDMLKLHIRNENFFAFICGIFLTSIIFLIV